jgi:hypothetical protein
MSPDKLKIPRKRLSILLAGSLIVASYTSLADWVANITIKAFSNGVEYFDSNEFGINTNATSNFDECIDLRDPPAQPSGVNTFQEPDCLSEILAGNYVGPNDTPVFRGVIEYNGITSTQTLSIVNGLPDNERWVMLTFSDDLYSNRSGAHNIQNGQEVNIGTDVHSYILAMPPLVTGISSLNDPERLSIEALFHCDDKIPYLDIKGSRDLTKDPFTNYVGQLDLIVDGAYKGTNSIPDGVKFFRLEIPEI